MGLPLAGERLLACVGEMGALPFLPPLPREDPHQLCQDRQEDDDGGCVAGKLGEEGDDGGDEQHGQRGWHVLQGMQLVTDPHGQP